MVVLFQHIAYIRIGKHAVIKTATGKPAGINYPIETAIGKVNVTERNGLDAGKINGIGGDGLKIGFKNTMVKIGGFGDINDRRVIIGDCYKMHIQEIADINIAAIEFAGGEIDNRSVVFTKPDSIKTACSELKIRKCCL